MTLVETTTQTQTPTVKPATPKAAPQEYAGFGRRFLAFFIDWIILGLIHTIIAIVFLFLFTGTSVLSAMQGDNVFVNNSLPSWVFFFAINFGYYAFFWINQDGQTLGNKLLAIKVITEKGGKLTIGTTLLRFIGYGIDFITLFIGFFWMLWDEKKQGLHDKIAGTIVVRTEKKGHVGIAIGVFIAYIVFNILLVVLFFGVLAALILSGRGTKPNDTNNQQQMEQQLQQVLPSGTMEYVPNQ